MEKAIEGQLEDYESMEPGFYFIDIGTLGEIGRPQIQEFLESFCSSVGDDHPHVRITIKIERL